MHHFVPPHGFTQKVGAFEPDTRPSTAALDLLRVPRPVLVQRLAAVKESSRVTVKQSAVDMQHAHSAELPR